MLNGIKAILFDLDGTLFHHLPPGGEVFSDYVSSLGIPITEGDRRRAALWEHYYFANSPEIQADHAKWGGEEGAFWSNFSHRRLVALGCSPRFVEELGPKLSAYMAEHYQPEIWVPEEVPTVLSELREAHFTLGVVSNRDNPYHDDLEEIGLQDHFDFFLAAGEVQSWKPDPEIFTHAVIIANATAQESMYIGDNYFADVLGARRAGLQPVLYDPKGLFHEPGCPVIASFNELIEILEPN